MSRFKHKIPCAACGTEMYFSAASGRPFTDDEAEKAGQEDWVCTPCTEQFSTEKLHDLVKRQKKAKTERREKP